MHAPAGLADWPVALREGTEQPSLPLPTHTGPFKDKYHALVKEIEQLYGSAKDKHAKGIQMLVNEFDYHVAYKRWSDSFTAVPFKPS